MLNSELGDHDILCFCKYFYVLFLYFFLIQSLTNLLISGIQMKNMCYLEDFSHKKWMSCDSFKKQWWLVYTPSTAGIFILLFLFFFVLLFWGFLGGQGA